MTVAEMVDELRKRIAEGGILDVVEFRGETTLHIHPARLHELLRLCRDELGFDYLLDISSLDHPEEEPRFEVVYELYGISHRTHLRVRSRVAEGEEVPTASDLWPTANWHEREIYDMMGIRFAGHPDLRRILMWDGYPYFPLRKDFPLAGKPSIMPDVAFSDSAPLEGGPFVTSPGFGAVAREPRSRQSLPTSG